MSAVTGTHPGSPASRGGGSATSANPAAPSTTPAVHSSGPHRVAQATADDPNRPTAPWLLRAAAGWSWRILAIVAAVYALLLLVAHLRVIALAMAAALLLTALIHPLFRRLHGLGMPRALAAALTLFTLILALAAVVALISGTTAAQLPELRSSVGEGIGQVKNWLVTGPLHLNAGQIDKYNTQISTQLSANRSKLATGALSGAALAVEVLAGALLALFATFFFLFDGPNIWAWGVRLFHPSARTSVEGAGAVAWQTLTGYIRGTVLVALVDALSIGAGLLFVGVPLVAPLIVVTFLGAFIPVAGATLAGLAAVLVALVSKGVVAALIVLGVVLFVQQVEGHILQPLVLGKSVRLHPLAIVSAITAGATLAGIPGAVVAVPLVAVLSRVTVYLSRLRREDDDEETAAAAEPAAPVADNATD